MLALKSIISWFFFGYDTSRSTFFFDFFFVFDSVRPFATGISQAVSGPTEQCQWRGWGCQTFSTANSRPLDIQRQPWAKLVRLWAKLETRWTGCDNQLSWLHTFAFFHVFHFLVLPAVDSSGLETIFWPFMAVCSLLEHFNTACLPLPGAFLMAAL